MTPSNVSVCLSEQQNLNVRFQYYSTYVVEGQTTGVKVYRELKEDASDYMGEFSVKYSIETEPYSAQAGIDFEGGTGILEFFAGEMYKVIDVKTYEDLLFEGAEFFRIKLSELEDYNEGPLAVNGYYPLYRDKWSANLAGDGAHTVYYLNGDNYYMPNGRSSLWYGDYPILNTAGSTCV